MQIQKIDRFMKLIKIARREPFIFRVHISIYRIAKGGVINFGPDKLRHLEERMLLKSLYILYMNKGVIGG